MNTLTSEVAELSVGAASRKGAKGDTDKGHNMDAYAVVHGANGITAAAVVDGIGDDENGALVMQLARRLPHGTA